MDGTDPESAWATWPERACGRVGKRPLSRPGIGPSVCEGSAQGGREWICCRRGARLRGAPVPGTIAHLAGPGSCGGKTGLGPADGPAERCTTREERERLSPPTGPDDNSHYPRARGIRGGLAHRYRYIPPQVGRGVANLPDPPPGGAGGVRDTVGPRLAIRGATDRGTDLIAPDCAWAGEAVEKAAIALGERWGRRCRGFGGRGSKRIPRISWTRACEIHGSPANPRLLGVEGCVPGPSAAIAVLGVSGSGSRDGQGAGGECAWRESETRQSEPRAGRPPQRGGKCAPHAVR